MTSSRHSWGDPVRIPNPRGEPWKTERECRHCGLVKVTRHETDERGFPVHWVEYWRDMEQSEAAVTPKCERVTASPEPVA